MALARVRVKGPSGVGMDSEGIVARGVPVGPLERVGEGAELTRVVRSLVGAEARGGGDGSFRAVKTARRRPLQWGRSPGRG